LKKHYLIKATVKRMAKKLVLMAVILLAVAGAVSEVNAQQKKRIIQLSGVVISDDTTAGPIPGVHIYVPKAGRGTTTNGVGFFSLPVVTGDSIVVSAVGFERQYYIVPANAPEYQTVIITLEEDATYLKEIVIMDFPTEEVFKEAVLALNIPFDDKGIDSKNLNQELLALMLKTTPMDGSMNQRYYLNQWAGSELNRFQPVANPFLNPFNWVKFFNSLKKDDKKKK
jgi:hypothetical protein